MEAWIDPTTGDYAVVDGRLTRDPAGGIANAAYLRVVTPLGQWFGDTTLGSRLYELRREKDVARVERLARQYVRDALQPMVTDGRVASMQVDTQRDKDASGGGRLLLQVQLTDARGSTSVFQVFVKVI